MPCLCSSIYHTTTRIFANNTERARGGGGGYCDGSVRGFIFATKWVTCGGDAMNLCWEISHTASQAKCLAVYFWERPCKNTGVLREGEGVPNSLKNFSGLQVLSKLVKVFRTFQCYLRSIATLSIYIYMCVNFGTTKRQEDKQNKVALSAKTIEADVANTGVRCFNAPSARVSSALFA